MHAPSGHIRCVIGGLTPSAYGLLSGFWPTSKKGPALWLWTTLFLITLGWVRWVALNWHPVGLHVEEAQYWYWSHHLDWGYYSKPPGIAALIAMSTALLGDGTNGLRALAMMCWLLSGGLLIKLGEWIHSRRAGLWACVLFSTTPAANLLGLVATTDAPLILGWTGTMALTWWACQSQRAWWRWALLGLSLGLTLNAKYTAAALVPSLLMAVWLSHRAMPGQQQISPWPGVCVTVLVAFVCLLPNLMWNAQHDWPTLQHTLDITWRAQNASKSGPMASPLLRMVYFAGGLFLLCGPALLMVAIARVAAFNGSKIARLTDCNSAWAALFVGPLFGVGVFQALLGGMQINWLAPVLPGLCLMAALGLVKSSTPRWAFQLTGLGLAASMTLSLWVAASKDSGFRPSLPSATHKPLDFWHKTRHWPIVLRELEPWFASHAKPVWTSERDVFVQTAYAMRHLSPVLLSYSATGRVRHHFDLFYSSQANVGAFLWVDRSPPPHFKDQRFTRQQLATSEHGGLRLELWLLTPLTDGHL